MKVILSRKGFDSNNGGIVSPIFTDGTMLSFPIPSKNHDKDKIAYNELTCNGVLLNKILADLGYRGDEYCHLDPDLDITRRVEPVEGWKPAFGQINQSASYLINNGIAKGDLFLFFGNFKHVVESNGKYKFASRNKNLEARHLEDPYYGREMQAIWGYLQVGEIILDPQEQKKFFWHPHACEERIFEEKNNLIFTSAEHLSFAPDMPGCGIFSYNKKRVLSMPGKAKATWKKEKAYDVDNIHKINNSESKRKNSAKDSEGIYYAGIWQELVLKENIESVNWAKSMFLCAE